MPVHVATCIRFLWRRRIALCLVGRDLTYQLYLSLTPDNSESRRARTEFLAGSERICFVRGASEKVKFSDKINAFLREIDNVSGTEAVRTSPEKKLKKGLR